MNRDYALVPFKAWHLEYMESRGLPPGGWAHIDERMRHGLELSFAWTTMFQNEPIACGGLIEVYPWRHGAWAYLNTGTGPHMRRITSHARWIVAQKKGRIELSVRQDFNDGHRWARALGFRIETPSMEKYGPDAETHTGYARMN